MSTSSVARSAPRPPSAREEASARLLDAAERLLLEVGHAGITTRRVADEAGVNHGLVHYYFGSMEELLLRVLERFTDGLIERQRAMYASPVPFAERWRTAMQYLEQDRPYQKIWFELQAMGWNHPEIRARLARVHGAWRDAMREAVRTALAGSGLADRGLSLEAWITLIVTMNEGIILERLSGIEIGHEELLAGIDRWLATLAPVAATTKASDPPARPRRPRRPRQ